VQNPLKHCLRYKYFQLLKIYTHHERVFLVAGMG
ncbi:hypothetical protein CP8484711_2022, partial [Chlamydia psittaci 84-8471/1]